ncbi:flagellar basal body P-ring protein FlgI [Acidobacteria bacterium AB60]|nr:flagellar basal body P-ring protein FlgI [Acidobacteria bacterium AB60]
MNSEFSKIIRIVRALGCGMLILISASTSRAIDTSRHVLVRDITTVEGVRDNMLVGYGLVVGLHGTGDRQQTFFTVQTLANAMQRMGVQISPSQVVVKNVASVFITASLPPFARPGTKLDITVSSIGDARSLEGGVLLMSALHAPDGQVYAEAQGPVVLGGYSVGSGGNTKQVNHATVGRIPEGAIVERDASVDLSQFKTVSFLLRNPDFTTAKDVADAVNREFHKEVATARDNSRVDIDVAGAAVNSVPVLISKVQNLSLVASAPAKVIVDERTGTIVMGGSVRLSPVSIIHGSLSIQIATSYKVSQPEPLSNGTTKTVPDVRITANDAPAQVIRLDEGASVEELINGLHTIGSTAHDIIAILEAIKAAGGLEAELEVL